MLYYNEYLGPIGRMFPDLYEAITIKDFIDNKEHLRPPSKLKILSPFILLDPLSMIQDVLILFHDVNLEFPEGNYKIYDITGEISVDPPLKPYLIMSSLSVKPKNLVEGRYFHIAIRYSVKKDRLSLLHVKKLGLPVKDRSKEKLEDLVYQEI